MFTQHLDDLNVVPATIDNIAMFMAVGLLIYFAVQTIHSWLDERRIRCILANALATIAIAICLGVAITYPHLKSITMDVFTLVLCIWIVRGAQHPWIKWGFTFVLFLTLCNIIFTVVTPVVDILL